MNVIPICMGTVSVLGLEPDLFHTGFCVTELSLFCGYMCYAKLPFLVHVKLCHIVLMEMLALC